MASRTKLLRMRFLTLGLVKLWLKPF